MIMNRIGLGLLTFLLGTWIADADAVPIANGDSMVGNIAVIGEVDSFTFSANAGDRIVFQVGEISGSFLDLRIELFDPNGDSVVLNSGSDSTDVVHQALLSGTYEARVDDSSTTPNGTGTYTAYLARVPGSFVVPAGDEGGALANGEIYAGDIELGDIDIWTVDAEAGDTLLFGLGEVGAGSGFEPELQLYGPDGALIALNSGTNSTDIAHRAVVAGRYTLLVLESSTDVIGSGSYQLYFAQSAKPFVIPTGDDGGALTNGGVQGGAIDSGDIDIWSFEADDAVTVLVGLAEVGTGNGFEPELQLYGPDGALVASNSGTDSTDIAVQIPTAGTYTLMVQESSTDVVGDGSYSLYFAHVNEPFVVPAGDEGGPLTSGQNEAGTIELGDIDIWTFAADADDSVLVGLGEVGAGNGFEPELRLYGPDGTLITSNSGTNSADVAHRATVAGTYTLIVQESSTDVIGVGDYLLYFANVAEPFVVTAGDESGALLNGETTAGDIDLGDIDSWTFSADALESIRIGIGEVGVGNGFEPELQLYDPTGTLVTSNSGTDSTDIAHRASVGGTFTLIVQEASTDVVGSGSYQLYLAQTGAPSSVTPPDEGGVLASGVTETGSIDLGDSDIWTFSADALDTIVLVLNEIGAGNGFDPLLLVYDPTGNLVASDSGTSSATTNFQATLGGTYTVVVEESSTDAVGTGDYDLTLTRTPGGASEPAGSITASLGNGGTATGTLLNAAAVDKYDLAVVAGEGVQVRLADLTTSNSISLTLQVFDSGGDLLARSSSNTVASVQFPAPATETLTLVATQNSVLQATYAITATAASQAFTIPSGDDGGTLVNGDFVAGDLTLGDIDHYDITVSAGQTLRLRLADLSLSNSVIAAMRLYAADGTLLGESTANTLAEIAYTADQAETVLVEVYKLGTPNATYELHTSVGTDAFATPPGDQGGALTDGDVASGTLTLGDLDLYTVAVQPGQLLRLRVADLSLNNSVTQLLRLYGADGSLLGTASANTVAEIAYQAEAAETLQVEVSKSGSPDGTYDLFTSIASSPFVIPAGDDG
ncbi:MAG: hypothetical protein AAFZ58_05460, partial [Pseudomonadota bacterium]